MPNIKHTFVSGKADGADATQVQPSNWNAEHTLDQYLDFPNQGTDPVTPGSGAVRLFGSTFNGSPGGLEFIDSSGVKSRIQPGLFGRNVIYVSPPSAAASVPAIAATYTITASAVAAATTSSTSRLTKEPRSTISTSTTAGNSASIRSNQLLYWRGNAAGQGGFLCAFRFGGNTLLTGVRAFFGLWDSTATVANSDPTTSTTNSRVGVAFNASTGNMNIVACNGTAVTSSSLGASFPVNTTDLYELWLYSAPNGTSINYIVTNLSTVATTSGSLSTNIPASTTFMAPISWMNNNAQAASVIFNYGFMYGEGASYE